MEKKLHSGLFHSTLREIQESNCQITAANLMYPLFIISDDNGQDEVKSMPGIYRYGINKLKPHLEPLVKKGLSSVLLFGVIDSTLKDSTATQADSPLNPVIRAIPKLKEWFPNLLIACDVCLCPYTDHGHCAILNGKIINNFASTQRIAEVALSYGIAGAHIVAPSDMMDNRIHAIKNALISNNMENQVALLSYSAKFASNFYGPFRDAVQSSPDFGDRRCYQLPSGSKGLAHRAVFYRDHKLLLVLFRVLAVMPILRSSPGRITFSWTSGATIYAIIFWSTMTIVVLIIGHERMQILLTTKQFDEYIYAIIFIINLIPHFWIPFVGWGVAGEVAKYKTSWGSFQQRDIEEGADMLIVKPAMPYLDIVKQTKDTFPHIPLFVYQVSGEYAMLYYSAKNGAFELNNVLMETMKGFRRAGADCIITYFTPLLLDLIQSKT